MKKLLITLASTGLMFANPAAAWWWWDTSGYTETEHPIVLAHGMAGFDNIGPVDYWYGIVDELEKDGAEVYVTQVSSFNSSEVRGEQLLTQVENILAATGAQKVNLMGHSHGSQSVRYVAGVIPHRVASVSTIGGPAKGSPVADLVNDISGAPVVGEPLTAVLSAAVDGFGYLTGIAAGEQLPQNSLAGLFSLTSEGAADFNNRFPAGVPTSACGEGEHRVNGVRYFSWSGTGASTGIGITNSFDPSSYALMPMRIAFESETDGLVGRCSSHIGRVIRDDYYMDHLDEVNQVFGLVDIWRTNPKTVFRQQANRLKNLGL